MHQPGPDDYNVPLTRWDHVWRTLVALFISGLAWGEIAYHEWTHDSPWFWVDLAGGVVAFALVGYRRR